MDKSAQRQAGEGITGLSDLGQFLEHVDAAIRRAGRDGRAFAVLAIHVAKLGESGSTGSARRAGAIDVHAMTQILAERLHGGSRAAESAAYLGDSLFAALLPTRPDDAGAAVRERAMALQTTLQAPVAMPGGEVFPEADIGIALFPTDGDAAEPLLAAAKAALAEAPASCGVSFSSLESNAPSLTDLQQFAALSSAIEHGGVLLSYQPKLSLDSGAIVGAEVLAHWKSPDFGDYSGQALNALVESTGQTVAFGQALLAGVCRQSVAWRAAGHRPVPLSVNITPQQFRAGDLARQVQATLIDSGADPRDLGVELTEGTLLPDIERATRILRELTAIGVSVTLDEFGTGYSSLSSLAQLPIDFIKIDRSLVHGVTAALESVSMTRSIIGMAHGLHLPVIADGVDSESQLGLLSAKDCDQVQGACFSGPLTADEFAAQLQQGRRLPERLLRRHDHRRTLLLVDDEVNVLAELKRLLRREGYQIVTAASGAEGLQCLAEHPVDVIVSDQRMPGMSGVEFLRRAKALYPDTVRLTLSGFTDLKSIIDAVNEGAIYKFLTKPWDDELLRRHLRQAFEHKEMADENKRLTQQLAGANAELESLNERLATLLQAQRAESELVSSSAAGARELLDLLPAAVFGLDPQGTLAYANHKALQLMPRAGAAIADFVGAGMPVLIDLTRLGDGERQVVDIDGHRCLATKQRLHEDPHHPSERGHLVMLVEV